MKRIIRLLSLLLITQLNLAFAQNCPQYGAALKRAKEELSAKNYDQALLNIQIAQTSAKDCQISSFEADDMVKSLLKKQAEDYHELTDKQLHEFAAYITSLTTTVKQEKHNNQGDVAAMKAQLLKTLMAAQQYISANGAGSADLQAVDTRFHLAESYEQSGDNQSAFDEYEQSFNMLKKSLFQKKYPRGQIPESVFVTCVNVSSRYATFLVNRGNINTAYLILNTCGNMVSDKPLSPDALDAAGRFQVAAAYVDAAAHNSPRAREHYKSAFAAFNKAIALQPHNVTIINDLVKTRNIIYLQSQVGNINTDSLYNAVFVPDRLVNRLAAASFSDINNAITYLQWRNLQSADFITINDIKSAIDSTDKTFQMVSEYLNRDPNQKLLLLIRAETHVIRAIIAHNQQLLKKEHEEITNAINDWTASIGDNQQLPTAILLLSVVANQIEHAAAQTFNNNEILDIDRQLNTTLAQAPQASLKSPEILHLLGNLNATDGRLSELSGDTIALTRYRTAINDYEASGIAKNLTVYSPDMATYGHAYSRELIQEIQAKDTVAAAITFAKLIQNLMPYYQEYNFDIPMGWELTFAAKNYGIFLYEAKQYRAAISPLEFASFHGIKSCSSDLAKIYGSLHQRRNEIFYKERALTQHDDDPYIVQLPLEGSISNTTISVYILDRPSDYPYKGIEDAAKYAHIAYHANIDTHYIEEFNKSQYLAWGNKSSYKMMSDATLKKAQDQIFILNKYAASKKQIEEANGNSKKLLLCNLLYKDYEKDINYNEKNRRAIVADAVNFYLFYARLLLNTSENNLARTVYQRVQVLSPKNKEALMGIMELDYDDNSKFFLKSHLNDERQQLLTDLDFYLSRGLYDPAAAIQKKLLHSQPDAHTRDTINIIYMTHGMNDQFSDLFLHDKKVNRDYIIYFTRKNIDSTSNDYKRTYYFDMVNLNQQYLKENPQDTEVRKIASRNCSNIVWYCIITHRDYNLNYWNSTSLSYDPNNRYAIANAFHIALYYNQVQAAKENYTTLKNIEFDKSGKYPTFRDYFLNSITEFRKNGLANESVNSLYQVALSEDLASK